MSDLEPPPPTSSSDFPPPPAPPAPPYGGHPPPRPSPYGPPGGPRLSGDQERTWASAAHWGALVASVVALAFLGPLVVLLVKGEESVWVRRQAVESLNFQLTVLVYGLVSLVLCLVLIGFLLLLVLGLAWLVLTILGAVRAANGDDFRYPLTIRMVS